jgi:hypothetical protein
MDAGTSERWSRTRSRPILSSVETQTVAEILPGLYRGVLDAVGALEADGFRPEAARIRQDAIRAYSGPWDPGAERQLRRLQARAVRVTSGRARRRRSAALEAVERRIDLGRTSV